MTRNIRVVSLVFVFLVAGALTASAGNHLNEFTADLSGANEVGDPGDPAEVCESCQVATFVIDLDSSEVCFSMHKDESRDPVVGAHIHEGGADVNGEIVVDLKWPDNQGEGCVTGDAAVVAAIVADPSGYDVNIHTGEFPAGAIRGQLVAAGADELPATGSDLTLFLLLAGVAFTAGGAIVYANRQSQTTH